jgi:hypothetical protein
MTLVGELEKKVAHVREIQGGMPQETDEEVAQKMFEPNFAALRTMRQNFGKDNICVSVCVCALVCVCVCACVCVCVYVQKSLSRI